MPRHFSHSSIQGFVPCKSHDWHQVQTQLVCSTGTSIDFPEPLCHRIRGAYLSSLFQPLCTIEHPRSRLRPQCVPQVWLSRCGPFVNHLFFFKRALFSRYARDRLGSCLRDASEWSPRPLQACREARVATVARLPGLELLSLEASEGDSFSRQGGDPANPVLIVLSFEVLRRSPTVKPRVQLPALPQQLTASFTFSMLALTVSFSQFLLARRQSTGGKVRRAVRQMMKPRKRKEEVVHRNIINRIAERIQNWDEHATIVAGRFGSGKSLRRWKKGYEDFAGSTSTGSAARIGSRSFTCSCWGWTTPTRLCRSSSK